VLSVEVQIFEDFYFYLARVPATFCLNAFPVDLCFHRGPLRLYWPVFQFYSLNKSDGLVLCRGRIRLLCRGYSTFYLNVLLVFSYFKKS